MDSKKKHPWLHGFGERPRSIWPMVPRCSSSTGGGHWVGQGSEMKCIFLCILLIDSRTFQYCIYRLYIIIYRYSCTTMIIYSFAYICIYTHLDCRLHLIIIQLTIKHILIYTYQKYGHQNVVHRHSKPGSGWPCGTWCQQRGGCCGLRSSEKHGGWDGPRHDHYKWGYKLWSPYNMPKMNESLSNCFVSLGLLIMKFP